MRLLFSLVTLVLLATACQGTVEPTPFPDEAAAVTTVDVADPSTTDTPAASPTSEQSAGTPVTEAATAEAADMGRVTRTVEHASTPRSSPTATIRPSPTRRPTVTPTSAPQLAPQLQITEPQPVREGVSTPATAVPTAVARFSMPPGTTNILLLGSDEPVGDAGIKRTDTMIVVSVNPDGPTASMMSLPRDLYVYIPGGTMNRLNAAITLGGVNLLKQTLLYNFGLPIHYFARVDFAGFEEVVDAVGGVEMAVSCSFKDWRIKSPELDPEDEDNWYVHELEPGIHEFDGEDALWYARSRLMSDDFDRGRRQQQLLRALLNQGVQLDMVRQVPTLWNSFQDTIETDMDIGRLLQLAALAPGIRENGIQNLYLSGKTESWTVPDTNAQVQLPVWEGPGKMEETFQRLFLPPALNRADRAPIVVEVINASGREDMGRLAAENLAWYGFVPVLSEEDVPEEEITTLTYYGPNFKGSYDWLISWIIHQRQDDIELDDQNLDGPYDYRLLLGADYDPCLNELFAPQSFLSN